jgi:hypothetical protein
MLDGESMLVGEATLDSDAIKTRPLPVRHATGHGPASVWPDGLGASLLDTASPAPPLTLGSPLFLGHSIASPCR